MTNEVMRRAAPVLLLLIPCVFAARTTAQDRSQPPVPLAYVRSLVVIPAALTTPADPAVPPPPAAAKKKEYARWQARFKARKEIVALRAWGLQAFEHAIEDRFRQVRGVTVNLHSKPAPYGVIKSAALAEDNSAAGVVAPVTRYSRTIADKYVADACLLTTIDRFNRNAGLERVIWIRVRAWLWRGDRPSGESGLLGPFYAVGRALAGRQLFRKGFSKTDEQIAEDAAVQAAGRITGTLVTGRTPLFMEDSRVAVLPAVIPATVNKSFEIAASDSNGRPAESTQTVTLPLTSLNRQGDVLFQPDTSPTAVPVDPDDLNRAFTSLGIQAADIWTPQGAPDQELLGKIAMASGAQYVFASRIRDVSLSERPELANDAGQIRPALHRQADVEVEGFLFGAREHAVLWRDTVEGGTIAITEYVRHQPRLRSDDQCIADAARTAYAHLRSSFEEFKRKYDRDTVTASRMK